MTMNSKLGVAVPSYPNTLFALAALACQVATMPTGQSLKGPARPRFVVP